MALDPQHGRQPRDPHPLDHLPAVLPGRVRGRALAGRASLPKLHYKPGYTSFQYVFVFLQSAAFGGVFTGFAVARDFQSGFARRLLLGAPRRGGIIAGYVVGALGRWLITGTIVTIAALIAGMHVDGGGGRLLGLLLPRRGHELHRCPMGDTGSRCCFPHRAGGTADPDAGVRGPVPGTIILPDHPDHGMGALGLPAEPGHARDPGRAEGCWPA